jgi:hypothetical protein
LPVLL